MTISLGRTDLLSSYNENKAAADKFREALKDELSELLNRASLKVATPIESRTKDWPSIISKADRLSEGLTDVRKLSDFIGLRLVFVFAKEVDQARKLISEIFNVIDSEDKSEDLGIKEFGYKSVHLVVQLKKEWINVPRYHDCAQFRAEIQVRTLSQHTWAVASRILQYHQESAVPKPTQRSIHRLAALLELVDLELERVDREKAEYAARMENALKNADRGIIDNRLNVDLLMAILNSSLPSAHKKENEPYAGLVLDLQRVGIVDADRLKALIDDGIQGALKNDAFALKEAMSGNTRYNGNVELMEKGVFYSQVGLIRNMLNAKFGKGWRVKSKRH